MFNRFSIKVNSEQNHLPANELLDNSKIGNLNPQLVNQVSQAARYELISSTGQFSPSLQGIWGGTWLPAWSGISRSMEMFHQRFQVDIILIFLR